MAFNVCNGNNLFNVADATSQRTLKLVKNEDSTWIYCNYPEALPTDALGDKDKGNHCLNQVAVEAGTHNIFYSYYNAMTTKDGYAANDARYFGIQIWNPYSTSITVQVKKRGHRSFSDDPLDSNIDAFVATAGVTVREYFNSTPEDAITVNGGSGIWICDEAIPNFADVSSVYNTIFCGLMEICVSGPAVVTVYVYNTKYKIDGNAEPYPAPANYPNYDELGDKQVGIGRQYSGYADYDGYETNGTVEIVASEIEGSPTHFVTHHNVNATAAISNFEINGVETKTDRIPIRLAYNTNLMASDVYGSNLGNWGAVYKIRLKLTNDTATARTFYGYVGCENDIYTHYPAIKTDNGFAYARLKYGEANAWRWLEQTVPANSSVEDTYYLMLCPNCSFRLKHIFSIGENEGNLNSQEV